jgi:hypothetical protein
MTIDGPELVVFDFDETIVGCNSDTFINELSTDGLIPNEIISKYWDYTNWTQCMSSLSINVNKFFHSILINRYETSLQFFT